MASKEDREAGVSPYDIFLRKGTNRKDQEQANDAAVASPDSDVAR
jgi:hypothetical protein